MSLISQIGRKLTPDEEAKVANSRYSISISKPTLQVILANGKVLDADILQYSPAVDQKGKDRCARQLRKRPPARPGDGPGLSGSGLALERKLGELTDQHGIEPGADRYERPHFGPED